MSEGPIASVGQKKRGKNLTKKEAFLSLFDQSFGKDKFLDRF